MGTILRDLSQMWLLVHCIIIFMLLYESRFDKKTSNVITVIFMILLVAVNLFSATKLGIEKAGQLLVLTCIVPSLIFFFIMSKNRNSKFLFTFCLVDTIVLEIMVVTKILDVVSGVDNYVVMFVSRIVIMSVIEFFVIKYIRRFYHIFQNVIKTGWGLFSLLSVLFYAALMLGAFYPQIITERPGDYASLILLMIIVPVMYCIIFRILYIQIESHKTEEENRVLSLQMDMAEERITSSIASYENIRIKRHDMKHYMLLLYDYIENGNMEGAKECINSINEDIDKVQLKVYCKNSLINMVVSYYDRLAENTGISINADIRLPEKLKISGKDIAVILSNALDNAINALKKCSDKVLYIKAFVDNGTVYLEIRNAYSGVIRFENGLPQSSKKDHGYGTRSIARLVENHNGIYSFGTENNMFVFRCAL